MAAEHDKHILDVRSLKKYYMQRNGVFSKGHKPVKAVDDISFYIEKGCTFGLVGESGCGKTTVGKTITCLEKATDGTILFEGKEIQDIGGKEKRSLYMKMQMVFQDPYSSLDPRKTVSQIISEPLRGLTGMNRKETAERVEETLLKCGLDKNIVGYYPHEFSGGQRQRICIARSLALKPDFLVCDEPVSALDVSVQAQIINLLKDLQESQKISMLFISHDLSVVEHISDKVGVMYLGKMMETASKKELFRNPLHPYTKALLSAVPMPDIHHKRKHIVLEGDVPSPDAVPEGCPFHTRCPLCAKKCREEIPELREVESGHLVRCLLV